LEPDVIGSRGESPHLVRRSAGLRASPTA